jgi:orotate phosphoribosyltransferase
VLQYPEYAEALCGRIAARFTKDAVAVVIAPALGGIVVGQEVGRQLNARSIFAERRNNELALRRGFEIAPGERVLVCEDVITTGGSVGEVLNIVGKSGGTVVGVGAIVDRSGGASGFENCYSTVAMKVLAYKPDACPLCKLGVPIETPGSREAPHGKAPVNAPNHRP